jgi:Kef-type K+ transport system membrane component KefB
MIEHLREHLTSLSPLARFSVALAAVFVMPPLARRLKLPPVVGLMVAGVLLGPYVLDIFGKERQVADFMADLGKLLLRVEIVAFVLFVVFVVSRIARHAGKS